MIKQGEKCIAKMVVQGAVPAPKLSKLNPKTGKVELAFRTHRKTLVFFHVSQTTDPKVETTKNRGLEDVYPNALKEFYGAMQQKEVLR